MGRACSTNGGRRRRRRRRRRRMYIGYWWESQMIRGHWEDQGLCGWRILKWILER
jgi:hypothetical protein